MRRIYLPLFWKFAIAIIVVVFVFGSINFYLIWTYTNRGIESETRHRLEFYAQTIAREVASHALEAGSAQHLQRLVNSLAASDTLIAYAVLFTGPDSLIVETFKDGLPANFFRLNQPRNESTQMKTLRFIQLDNKRVLDIAAPLSDSSGGMVRIGMFRERTRSQIANIFKPYILMVLGFLGVGIIGALFFSFVITRRVNSISQIAANITFKNLKNGKIPRIAKTRWLPQVPRPFEADDELDDLSYQINSMIDRLEKAYGELEQTYARFVQTEKLASIGVLSAGVAHEINNPVAGIQNCIRRIKNHPEDVEKNRQYIQLIEDAVDKTRGVVGRLLDYSRSPQSVKQAVEPAAAIEKSLLLVSYRLEKSRISVIKNIPHSVPSIYANQNELEQIFVNLLLNGIDAIDEQQQRQAGSQRIITIDAEQSEDQGLIKISDTGIGMTPAQQAKMFDPFYTTKDTGKGTGLGMYVVYNLVKSNNGNIQCQTERHNGTQFILKFLQAGKVD